MAMAKSSLTTVNAADFGFNALDATDALQKAIDSGADRVIVPKMDSDWTIRPIVLTQDNQEILFESGVTLYAKKGEFKGEHDSLLRMEMRKNITLTGYGATFKMRCEDYRQPPYISSGHRMAILILGCANIQVFGLCIASAGAYGLYIGSYSPEKFISSQNILIKDVILTENDLASSGIPSGVNVRFENCIFSNSRRRTRRQTLQVSTQESSYQTSQIENDHPLGAWTDPKDRLNFHLSDFPLVPEGGVSFGRKSFIVPEHLHDAFEINYLHSGEMSLELEGSRKLRFQGGNLAIIQPGISHAGEYDMAQPGELLWMTIKFNADHAEKGTPFSPEELKGMNEIFQKAGSRVINAPPEMKTLFQELQSILRVQKKESLAIIRTSWLKTLLIQMIIATFKAFASSSFQIEKNFIVKAKEYIEANASQKISLPMIAAHVGLSLPGFCKYFKDQVGQTPAVYMMRVRCSKAREMLMRTLIPITQIAYDLGFSSSQHFAGAFKKYTGMTPLEFRKKFRITPEVSIQYESWNALQRLENIQMINCYFKNQYDGGILLWMIQKDDRRDISFKFEHCHVKGGMYGLEVGKIMEWGPKGSMVFSHCTFSNNMDAGIKIVDKRPKALLKFEHCLIQNAGYGALMFEGNSEDIEMSDCVINDFELRPFMRVYGKVAALRGDLVVNNPHEVPIERNTNLKITKNKIAAPKVFLESPKERMMLKAGALLELSAREIKPDASNPTNKTEIEKVIFSIQRGERIIGTWEVNHAPWEVKADTSKYEPGIYLLSAKAISRHNANAVGFDVVPIQISSKNCLS